VGAPGARNWLIKEVLDRGCQWTAFLDDDVDLPKDWLGRLAAAAKAYPESGVWGVKVVNATVRAGIQGADFTLQPDAEEQPSLGSPGERPPRPLALSALHHFDPDYGQFRYMRPCASVMGCCHLFRTATLEQLGGFDLRFSPSQFDDVDHDLRLLAAGMPAAYQGHCTVGHRRPFPHLANVSWEQAKSAEANHYKLRAKHSAHMDRLLSRQESLLLADLNAKWRRLLSSGALRLGS
ncbi:MAG: glycosyltransferase family 2 protein, partial [Oceanidesulfovibrio sp.]